MLAQWHNQLVRCARMRPLPRATTRELVVHLSTSSVCPPPAFIAMTSCASLIPPNFLVCSRQRAYGPEHAVECTSEASERRFW